MSISYSILVPIGQVEEALIESCFVVLGSEKLATQAYMVTGCPYSLDWTTGLDYWTQNLPTVITTKSLSVLI